MNKRLKSCPCGSSSERGKQPKLLNVKTYKLNNMLEGMEREVTAHVLQRGDAILNRWSVLSEKVTPEQRFDVGRKLVMQVSME